MPVSNRSQLNHNWTDPRAITPGGPGEEMVACPQCKCQWMEHVEVYQFAALQSVLLGQKPVQQVGPFFMLRCVKCGQVIEPNIQIGQRTAVRAQYDKMINQVLPPESASGEKL